MQVKRISNKITKSYLMDPYAMMMHYKRAFKLLDAMKRNSAKVLILGNKNQFGISWKGHFAGVEFDTGVVDEKLISGATKHYEMILCLDPVLYCRSLYKINLPVMMCATPREITEHPEILDVTDYLLPSPTRRHDAALRAMVGLDVLGESPDSSDPGPEATREVRGFPAKNDKSASLQRTGLEQKKEEKKDGDGEASEEKKEEQKASDVEASEANKEEQKASDVEASEEKKEEQKASDGEASEANKEEQKASDVEASEANKEEQKASDVEASEANKEEQKASDVEASEANKEEQKASDVEASEAKKEEQKASDGEEAKKEAAPTKLQEDAKAGNA